MEGVRGRRVRVRGGIHRGGEGGRGGGMPEAEVEVEEEEDLKQEENLLKEEEDQMYQIKLKRRRKPILTQEQDREIINMVLANNAIRLREIQANIIGDHAIFNTVMSI